jgi:hypothetical protein
MNSTYTAVEIKEMISTLDEEGIEILTHLLINEQDLFTAKEFKTISALLRQRIEVLRKNLSVWTSLLCNN